MRKRRLKVVGTVILLLVMLVFAGCKKNDEILSKHSEHSVSIYSSVTCSVNISLDITENKQVSHIEKTIDIKAGEVQTLDIQDLVPNYFSKDARITGLNVENEGNSFLSKTLNWLPWTIIAMMTIYILFSRKSNKKDTK